MLDVPISCEGIMHVYPRVPRVVIRTGRIQVASRVAYWVCDVCCESAGTIVILVCVSCSEHATSLERDNRNRTGPSGRIDGCTAGARAGCGPRWKAERTARRVRTRGGPLRVAPTDPIRIPQHAQLSHATSALYMAL